ncbi:MAG: hypothetical protein AAF713_15315 [Pseudomonadota bacterium]
MTPRPTLAAALSLVLAAAACAPSSSSSPEETISALAPAAVTPSPTSKPQIGTDLAAAETLTEEAVEGTELDAEELALLPAAAFANEETPSAEDAAPVLAAAAPPEEAEAQPAAQDVNLPLPQPGAPKVGRTAIATVPEPDAVRDIFMALQPAAGRPVSVIFAMDENRNGDPSDDAAVRLTPENGSCNPQLMRRFDFPAEAQAAPVFSIDDVRRGVSARTLPSFIATSVSQEMISKGLASGPDETRPQNLCSYELWRRQVIEFNVAQQDGAETGQP